MNAAQNVVGDAAVGQVYVGDRIYAMTADMQRRLNNDLPAIRQIPLTGLNGARIPLGLVAHIALQTGEANLAHEMNHRQSTIRLDNGQLPPSHSLAAPQGRIPAQVPFDPAR